MTSFIGEAMNCHSPSIIHENYFHGQFHGKKKMFLEIVSCLEIICDEVFVEVCLAQLHTDLPGVSFHGILHVGEP